MSTSTRLQKLEQQATEWATQQPSPLDPAQEEINELATLIDEYDHRRFCLAGNDYYGLHAITDPHGRFEPGRFMSTEQGAPESVEYEVQQYLFEMAWECGAGYLRVLADLTDSGHMQWVKPGEGVQVTPPDFAAQMRARADQLDAAGTPDLSKVYVMGPYSYTEIDPAHDGWEIEERRRQMRWRDKLAYARANPDKCHSQEPRPRE